MRKRITSLLLTLAMLLSLVPAMGVTASAAETGSGSGTKSDPIVVTTFEELKAALEKDVMEMQYIKVPGGTNINTVLSPETYSTAIAPTRNKTLIVDGSVTVTGSGTSQVLDSLFAINGNSTCLNIKGNGTLTFSANGNNGSNAVVRVSNDATLNVSGGVTLSGKFNTAVYGMAVYNYDGTVNIDDATLTGETGGVSYGAAIFATGGTTSIKNATLKSSVSPGASIVEKDSGTIFIGKDAYLTIENSTVYTTDGVTDGHSIYLKAKQIKDYLGANQKIYKLSDNTPLSADVSSLTDSVNITDDVSEEINTVSLTVEPLINREMISDLVCSYSPSNKMTLSNFIVYKGQNNTSDKIEDKNTQYDSNQNYTVMYFFDTKAGFRFSDNLRANLKDNVTVTGGDFWMADDFGGKDTLRVFVNFPAASAAGQVVKKVDIKVKPEAQRTKLEDFNCQSYTPTDSMGDPARFLREGLNTDGSGSTPASYDKNKDYSVVYEFPIKSGCTIAADISKADVTINDGHVWKVSSDSTGEHLLVYVNFPAKAAEDPNYVTEAAVQVAAVAGEKPSFNGITVTSSNADKIKRALVLWRTSTPFVAGQEYTTTVYLEPKEGVTFADDMKLNVNGKVVDLLSKDPDGSVQFRVKITATGSTHTHSYGTDWKYDDTNHWHECECGDKADIAAHSASEWIVDTADDTKHYKECSVCGHKIVANHVESSKITDTPADIGTPGAWHTVCVDCGKTMNTGTFPALVKIDVAKLNVAKPVKDAAAEMATTGDSTYYVANTEWTAADGATLTIGEKFKPGTAYTVKITLEAKNSNVFTADSTYNKIEGKDAKLVTAVTGYADSVILTYTFDATEGTYVPTKPAITTAALPDGKVGDAYSQTLAATGTNPITWGIEAGDLPDGLTLVGDTIKGTPSKAGEFKFTVKATNGGGSDTKELTIKIADAETAKYHNVTLTGAGTGATGAGSHAAGTTVNIYAGTKSGYTFNGWTSGSNVVFDDPNAEETTFTMPDGSVTVTANWSRDGGSSSSGRDDSDPSYAVGIPDKTENGSVSVSPKNASQGDRVTVTVKPDAGYELDSLKVLDKDGKELALTDKGDGRFTFIMPAGKVEVKAAFTEEVKISPFRDVPTDAYYYEAVKWAQKKGITGGIGDGLFGPNQPCTRAQIVTFLWRAAGSPVVNYAMDLADVSGDAYYAEAVRWALSQGITTGTADGRFAPDATCTRAQGMTFLFRASKASADGAPAFSDVAADAYYAEAVKWDTDNGITNGTTSSTFSPGSGCTRAQIVTFLWRLYAEK